MTTKKKNLSIPAASEDSSGAAAVDNPQSSESKIDPKIEAAGLLAFAIREQSSDMRRNCITHAVSLLGIELPPEAPPLPPSPPPLSSLPGSAHLGKTDNIFMRGFVDGLKTASEDPATVEADYIALKPFGPPETIRRDLIVTELIEDTFPALIRKLRCLYKNRFELTDEEFRKATRSILPEIMLPMEAIVGRLLETDGCCLCIDEEEA